MVVGNFTVNKVNYVVVKMGNAAHIMPEDEWGRCKKLISDRK